MINLNKPLVDRIECYNKHYKYNKSNKDVRKHILLYKNDFRNKKKSELDITRFTTEQPHNDMDTLEYRINECTKNGGKSLDLSHLDLQVLPDCIPKTIKYLFIGDNELVSLKGLHQLIYLEVIDCGNNHLTKLPILPSNLEEILCSNNYLTDISPITTLKKLLRLDCSCNKIEIMPTVNSLKTLVCADNKIKILPSLFNATKIYCKNNKLTKLGQYPKLVDLDCGGNELSHINEYLNLIFLACNDNKITILDFIAPKIQFIQCNGNKIEKLPYYKTLRELLCDTSLQKISRSYKVKEIEKKGKLLQFIFDYNR